jgi:hypothetical protein
VLKKQGRLQVTEKAERFDIGDVYLWTALDQETKLVPSFAGAGDGLTLPTTGPTVSTG